MSRFIRIEDFLIDTISLETVYLSDQLEIKIITKDHKYSTAPLKNEADAQAELQRILNELNG